MLPTFISPIIPQELCPLVATYEKLNHKVGQAILVSGPCALGKQTFSAISSLLLCKAFCSLATAEQGFSKQDRKGSQGPKQDDVYCTNTPSEHQPYTITALQSTLCVVVTVVQCRKGREPEAQSGGLHSILRHKDNWQEKKRESFIRKNNNNKKINLCIAPGTQPWISMQKMLHSLQSPKLWHNVSSPFYEVSFIILT